MNREWDTCAWLQGAREELAAGAAEEQGARGVHERSVEACGVCEISMEVRGGAGRCGERRATGAMTWDEQRHKMSNDVGGAVARG